MYVVLGILYESYIHPVTILSTLPSAGVGALLALLLTHTDLSVIALIGIILLIGLVKKNAIMMIDFAIEVERRDHKTPKQAVFEASLLRFRPIMMTTMAALLGGVPLAVGMGMGSELRRPLGISIVGGLIVSQALTLYTTPVIYLYMDRLNLWMSKFGFASPPRGSGHRGACRNAVRRRYRMSKPLFTLLRAAPAAALSILAACNFAPHYERPEDPDHRTPTRRRCAGGDAAAQGWKIAAPRDAEIRDHWWEMFDDPKLDDLEERVAISNQNIIAAEANYRAAYALVLEAQAAAVSHLQSGAVRDPRENERRARRHRRRHASARRRNGNGDGYDHRHRTTGSSTAAIDDHGAAQHFHPAARGVLSDRSLGQHPQHRGGEPLLGAGERGDARQRAAQHAEHARAGLFPAARRGRAAAHSGHDRRRLRARALAICAAPCSSNGLDSDEDVASAETQLDSAIAQATDVGRRARRSTSTPSRC